ncbi:MAG: dethiobiotin synthase [Rhodoplanes sp.]|jgi:dethiobiotin synthetase|nr:dethiobiotin synthase [Rhodoplanes sp.]
MTTVFVTATGTEVGKTVVARGLIKAVRAQGRAVEALKPVVSGYDPREAAGSDPGLLLTALGEPITPDGIARISPFRFTAPVSPHLAARREGKKIDFNAVVELCRWRMQACPGVLIIEGVGGIMAPLEDHRTVLDWMVAINQPIILVAGSYLGTLSHTFSAIDVLERRDLSIAALVVNETAGSPVSFNDTVESIRTFCPTLDVQGLPWLANGNLGNAVFQHLAAKF